MRSDAFFTGRFHGFTYFARMNSLRLPNGKMVILTPLEARIWLFLTAGEGQCWTRNALYQACFPSSTTLRGRSLDSHVCRLRQKLAPFEGILQSVYGKGYRIVMEKS